MYLAKVSCWLRVNSSNAEVEKTVLRLGALVDLAEDPDLVLSSHLVDPTTHTSSSSGTDGLLQPPQAVGTHMMD